jgi:hypothetical protein
MSSVACFAEPKLGRKIPEDLRTPIAEKCTAQLLGEILTATRCTTLMISEALLE